MNLANPLWVHPASVVNCSNSASMSARSVAKYMAGERRGPSQGWRTFLCNHADGIASMDLFVVPTLSFRLLYGFLVLRHHRRRIMWLGATANPTGIVSLLRPFTGYRNISATNIVTIKLRGPFSHDRVTRRGGFA